MRWLVPGVLLMAMPKCFLCVAAYLALATGLGVKDVTSWPDRIDAVTAASVLAAARKWLEKKRSVTGFLLPKETADA